MKFDALSLPVSKEDIKAFVASHKLQSGYDTKTLILIVLIIAGGLLFTILGISAQGDAMMASTLTTISVVVLIVAVSAVVVMLKQQARRDLETGIKIEKLAQENGWLYTHSTRENLQQGTVFTAGDNRTYRYVVDAKKFQVGRYDFETGSGRNRHEYHYGYMSMPLARNMPNIVLDSKSNNLRVFGMDISNLPVTLDRKQVVSLEGDFDKYYTLYVPEDYGFDIRYILTPDVMSALINESDNTDMEIIDNTLYIYFGRYDIDNVAFWQRVDKLYQLFEDKIVEKTETYRDDRTVDGTIATEGKRLKRSVPILIIIIIVIYVLSQLLEFFD